MSLFFKRIRQKLLIKKRFGKYTLYAIGEVLIIIIGILFALQVNRRDQLRRDRIIEISILKTIKGDLERDLDNLQGDIDLHKLGMVSSQIIQDHLEYNLPYNDSLPFHFLNSFVCTFWMYNSSGIQSMRSLGVNTITNEQIRSQIIQLYDYQYDYQRLLTTELTNMMTFGEQNILLGRFEQAKFYDDLRTEELWDGVMVPLDYKGLTNDDEFIYHLKSFYNLTSYYLVECDRTKNMISRAILKLEEELNRLEK